MVLAVAGEPETTATLLTLVPSRVKLTVPEGRVLCVVAGVMVADTESDAPPEGVVVAGVTIVLVVTLGTVTVTEAELEDE